MTRWLAMLVLVAAIGLTTGAREQGYPNAPVREPLDFAPIVLRVACGELFEAPCAKVLPRLAARTAQAGLDLKPVESGGAIDTAAAVCQGQAAAAIVQRDAIALIGRQPPCLGRYDIVGRPLYPRYALLVVRAGASFRSLDDLAEAGRRTTVAVGAEGSAAQVTFGFLLRSNTEWQRAIAVTNDDAETALERVAGGSIDGLFAMGSLDDALINRVRLRTDTRGKPVYAFIDVRAGSDFFRVSDGAGHCLYRVTALDFGGPTPVTTVSVDAVLLLGRGFREAHARSGPVAWDALASAIDATQTLILAALKSPADWRPAGAACM